MLRWIMPVVREALLLQDETVDMGHEIAGPGISELAWTARKLSYAFLKVWAQMFNACNSPWSVVGFIGQNLDQYATWIASCTLMHLIETTKPHFTRQPIQFWHSQRRPGRCLSAVGRSTV